MPKERSQSMKVTVIMENIQVEMDGKKYQISTKDGTIMIYSDDGVEARTTVS